MEDGLRVHGNACVYGDAVVVLILVLMEDGLRGQRQRRPGRTGQRS